MGEDHVVKLCDPLFRQKLPNDSTTVGCPIAGVDDQRLSAPIDFGTKNDAGITLADVNGKYR